MNAELQLELQKACHTAPSEIRCEDDIPEVRQKLKEKLRKSQSSNVAQNLHPVYNPTSSVRTCDPCPPVPREPISTISDTLNCRYEDDKDDGVYQEGVTHKREIHKHDYDKNGPNRKVQFETKCREFTPTCGGTDSVNFQVS